MTAPASLHPSHARYPAWAWADARRRYEREGASLWSIARALGCAYRTVTLRKRREGWTREVAS
jgi:hypothetical protein